MTNLQTIKTQTEAETLKADIETLKADVAKFASDAKSYGEAQTHEALEELKLRLRSLKRKGKSELRSLEEHVVAEPSKSVAIAFFAGVVTSVLLGGRR